MSQGIDLLTTADYKAKLDQCIHCGMCLEACPTYAVFDWEMDSPRGRITLMRAASEGRLTPDEFATVFTEHIGLCLGCLACESACPSGVQYNALYEGARVAIEQQRTPGAIERVVRWISLRQMLPHRSRLRLMARLMWLYQVTGVQRVVRASNLLPKPLRVMENILPPIVPRYRDYRRAAPAIGPKRGQVAFFMGCVQEAFLSPVNEATIRVLQRNGYEVHFPKLQTCCGAPHIHGGMDDWAKDLARRNIDALLSDNVVAVINNAGGCGFALKDYPHLLKDDAQYVERATQLAAKIKDVSEFLADHLHVPPQGAVNARVVYADSCHLRHGQKVIRQPRALLKSIPGLELAELARPERCCGSAGVYNILHPDPADQILDMKMEDIAATGAQVIVAANTGCYMQYLAGVRRHKLNATVMHVVEVLEQSYRAADKQGVSV